MLLTKTIVMNPGPQRASGMPEQILQFEVSVTALACFERQGDINARLSSQSSAMEGIRGHQAVQANRPAGYQRERSVNLCLKQDQYELRIRGRADGYQPMDHGQQSLLPRVEEIKTTRLAVQEIPDLLKAQHNRQLALYGYLLCLENSCEQIELQLTYFNLDDLSQNCSCQVYSLEVLQTLFDDILSPYLHWLQTRISWIKDRNQSIAVNDFPFPAFRRGQRELATSVYRTINQQRQLVLQAPTGLGKTLATLFPAIKSMATTPLEKVFFLTAKTAGQHSAEQAVSAMQNNGAKIRGVTISSKSRTCFNPDLPCDPQYCRYASGYYQRLSPALAELRKSTEHQSKRLVEATARQYTVCPFELALDSARDADVVIADYNYLFEPAVRLKRFFEDQKGDYAALIDEAHNLVERGREMFSASIEKNQLLKILNILKSDHLVLAKRLQAVNRSLLGLKRSHPQLTEKPVGFPLDKLKSVNAKMTLFCQAMEDHLEDFALNPNGALDLYFDFQRFLRIYEQADQRYVAILNWTKTAKTLKLFCIDPSTCLQEGFKRLNSAVCFSATMMPKRYFSGLLGLSQEASWQQVPSPFPVENLGVLIASYIPVTFRARRYALQPLVQLIHQITHAHRGNYLVYFPSLQFLGQVAEAYARHFPEDNMVVQHNLMDDHDSQQFLARFSETEQVTGFAVIGGRFSEGIDLVGNRLIGAIIIGTGLPQINSERDFIKDYYQEGGAGFEMAYQLPGMNRILQTAGRVIRGERDKGLICLVDPRFTEPRYRQLMPEHWPVDVVSTSAALQSAMAKFWSKVERDGSMAVPSSEMQG